VICKQQSPWGVTREIPCPAVVKGDKKIFSGVNKEVYPPKEFNKAIKKYSTIAASNKIII